MGSEFFPFRVDSIQEGDKNWPRGYKTFFMLNSAEHEICFVYKS